MAFFFFFSFLHTFIHFPHSFIEACIPCLLFSQPASNYVFERWPIWKATKETAESLDIFKCNLNKENRKVVRKGLESSSWLPPFPLLRICRVLPTKQGPGQMPPARLCICSCTFTEPAWVRAHAAPVAYPHAASSCLWFQLFCHADPWQLASSFPGDRVGEIWFFW